MTASTASRTDASRTALLLVDLQQDWFAAAELARCRDDLVAAVTRPVVAGRSADVTVLEVRTEHEPDGSTWTLSMREDGQAVVVTGTPGATRVEGLPSADEVVVKRRDSAFFGTDLADRLRRRGIEHLVLVGVSTESCIAATARDAFAHDLRVTLVEDATASVDRDLHRQTLTRLAEQYRQEVVPIADVLDRWRR